MISITAKSEKQTKPLIVVCFLCYLQMRLAHKLCLIIDFTIFIHLTHE